MALRLGSLRAQIFVGYARTLESQRSGLSFARAGGSVKGCKPCSAQKEQA